jgi:hypothetical protein
MSDLWTDGQVDDLSPEIKKRSKPRSKPKRKDFIHEQMAKLALGLDAKGRVWAYLLQQRRMQPSKLIAVGNVRLARFGVGRFAKARALRSLERAGLIRVERSRGCNPRIKVLV